MMARATTAKELGRELRITTNTARTYLHRLYRDMEVHSRIGAVQKVWEVAHQEGVLSPADQRQLVDMRVATLVENGALPGTPGHPMVPAKEEKQYLSGSDVIYGVGARLCRAMERGIKTVVYGRSAKAPLWWAQAVAARLRETKLADRPARYECVLAIDLDRPPPRFNDGVEERFRLYEEYGVRDLVDLYILDWKNPPAGSDVLIVDERHVLIGVMTLPGVLSLHDSLFFEDRPAVGEAFARWFDEAIVPPAAPYGVARAGVAHHPSHRTRRASSGGR